MYATLAEDDWRAGGNRRAAGPDRARLGQRTHARIEYRGQAIVPTGTTFEGTEVGGLSSITYDAKRGVFYTISDDPRDSGTTACACASPTAR